jgi:hypothetical protein
MQSSLKQKCERDAILVSELAAKELKNCCAIDYPL